MFKFQIKKHKFGLIRQKVPSITRLNACYRRPRRPHPKGHARI